MLEIERKILDINPRTLIARIKKLRPKPRKIFQGLVRIKYFDFPDRRIYRSRDLLRLRQITPTRGKLYTELVYKIYKCVKNNCKYFDEIEIVTAGADHFEILSKFLECIGLKQTVYYEKKRTLFRWKLKSAAITQAPIAFEIDEHPAIPPFLEIEAPSPSHIERCIKLLGLENHETTPESISELLRRKYPRIKLNGLRFRRKGL